MTIFTNLVQVIMPQFLVNRAPYEARERHQELTCEKCSFYQMFSARFHGKV